MCNGLQFGELNYWITGIEAALQHSPLPSVPPNTDIQTPIDRLDLGEAAIKMHCSLYMIILPDKERLVSESTYLKIHSLSKKVLQSSTIGPNSYKILGPLVKNIEELIRSKINPYFFREGLLKREPQNLSISELRMIDGLLNDWVFERKSLYFVLLHEFLNMCSTYFIHKAEGLGGIWKPARKVGWENFDWEKIPNLSAEAITICAALERAQQQGELHQVLQNFTTDLPFFDISSKNVLSIWQKLVVIQSLCQMEDASYENYSLVLQKFVKSGVDSNVSDAIQTAIEKTTSLEFSRLQHVDACSKEVCSFDTAFGYLCRALKRIFVNAIVYRRKRDEISSLYQQGYALYYQAMAHKKGFNPHVVVTPEDFARFSVPVFRMPDEILADLEKQDWFDIFCQGGKRALCEHLFHLACPQDEIFIREVLEYLGLDKRHTLIDPPRAAPSATPISPDPQKGKKKEDDFLPQPSGRRFRKTARNHHKAAAAQPSLAPLPETSTCPQPVLHPSDEMEEETSSLTSSFAALCISEKQAQATAPIETFPPSPSVPSFCAAAPPAKIPAFRYHVAQRAINQAERVQAWMRAGRKTIARSEEERQAVVYHSYPIFLTKIIMAHIPVSSWVSPATKKKNEHYSCFGSIHRYRDGLPPVMGYFGECFDADRKNELYHHFFQPCSEKSLASVIERYSMTGTFIEESDLKTPPSLKKELDGSPSPEKDATERYLIQTRRYSLTVDDPSAGISYTITFPNSLDQEQ